MQGVAKEQKIRSWQLFSFFTAFVHRDWIAVVFFALKHHCYLSEREREREGGREENERKGECRWKVEQDTCMTKEHLRQLNIYNLKDDLAASLKPIISNCAMLAFDS
ncbi:hypothetical protein T4B_15028 [Trichinella pseudospiralis]|uniref:Uncharacterized protein n=1 Tax=Trichinella pseudospiralis TaxID=6337 RepID=A0A0V1JCF1_TRIPS|nr:hypothetical protein T4B_15028 [Trichinella pseudospiralis]KRZ40856.1 hypothetical protein T4C_2429 [Trichinella pseudospiralis]